MAACIDQILATKRHDNPNRQLQRFEEIRKQASYGRYYEVLAGNWIPLTSGLKWLTFLLLFYMICPALFTGFEWLRMFIRSHTVTRKWRLLKESEAASNQKCSGVSFESCRTRWETMTSSWLLESDRSGGSKQNGQGKPKMFAFNKQKKHCFVDVQLNIRWISFHTYIFEFIYIQFI